MWTKSREVEAPILFHPFGIPSVLLVAIVVGVTLQVCAAQVLATKRNHDLTISLTSKAGAFDRKDEYCVLFGKTNGGEPPQVEDVFIDFSQQVGRLRERPQRLPLAANGSGRNCGTVDLGIQYYRPAFYYLTVHYTDASRRRKACRFFLTLK